MLRGFHAALPDWAAKGHRVRFPKGTTLRSLHPQRKGPYMAARAQIVTVHHTLPGMTVRIGTVYSDGHFAPEQRLKDVADYAKRLGMENPWRDADATFAFLRQHAEERPHRLNAKLTEVVLHVENPKVCWPGSGGYWVEAEINDCTPVTP